jgi:hypothetical protein
MRKTFLSERNLVIVLFVMVLVIFSFAHEDTKRFETIQPDPSTTTSSLNADENPATSIRTKEIIPPVQLR